MPYDYTQESADKQYHRLMRLGYTDEEASEKVQQVSGFVPRKGQPAAAAAPATEPTQAELDTLQMDVEEGLAARRAGVDHREAIKPGWFQEIEDLGHSVSSAFRKQKDRVKRSIGLAADNTKNAALAKVVKHLEGARDYLEQLPEETQYMLAVYHNRASNFIELTAGAGAAGLSALHQTWLAALMLPTDDMDWEGVKRRGEKIFRWPTEERRASRLDVTDAEGNLTPEALQRAANQSGEGFMVPRDSIQRAAYEQVAMKNGVAIRWGTDQVFEDLIKVRALADSNGTRLSDAVFGQHWLDYEPNIMEEMLEGEEQLLGMDVLGAWFPNAAWDEMGMGMQIGVTGIATAIDFLDPLMLAELAPRGFTAAGQGIAAITGGRVAPWQKVAEPLADVLAMRAKAVTKLDDAAKAVRKALPEDLETATQKLHAAEAEYLNIESTVRTVLPESKDIKALEKGIDYEELGKAYLKRVEELGPVPVKGPIRRAPQTVLNAADDGPTPAKWIAEQGGRPRISEKVTLKRRQIRAEREASVPWVNKHLDEVYGGRAEFEKKLRHANDLIKAPKDDWDPKALAAAEKEIDEAFEGWIKLPGEVRRHLHIQGWSPERIQRQAALRNRQVPHNSDLGFADVETYRAFMGADDGEQLADAVRRVLEGAHFDDVMTPGALLPEYTQGKYAEWGDGTWINNLTVPNRINTETGLQVMSDKLPIRMGRAIGGLVPGSLHMKAPQIFFDGISWADDALRGAPSTLGAKVSAGMSYLNDARQPLSRLNQTLVYDTYRAGHGNYMTHVIAEENWLEGILRTAGIAKRNKNGRIVYTGDGQARGRAIFHALDSDGVDAANRIAKLPLDDQKVYFHLRRYFDNAADQLGLEGQMRLSGYAPHVFPVKDMAAGARPIEFVGLPLRGDVAFNHLLPRTGAKGYSDDLLDIVPAYIRGKNRKLDMEPTFNRMLKMADDLEDKGDGATAQYVREMTKVTKGYPQTFDERLRHRWMKSHPEHDFRNEEPWTQLAMATSSAYYTGLLAGNPNYFMQNFATAATATAGRYGALETARGLLKMIAPGARGKAARELAEQSGAASSMRHAMQVMDDSKFGKYVDWVGRNLGIEHSEFINRGLTFHTSLSTQLKSAGMTWEEAKAAGVANALIAQAVKDAERIQHVYGRIGKSPYMEKILGRGLATTTTQFLSFPFKQGELMVSLGKENPGYVLRYMAYCGLFQRMASDAGLNLDSSVGAYGMAPLQMNVGKGTGLNAITSPPVDGLIAAIDLSIALLRNDPENTMRAAKEFGNAGLNTVPLVRQAWKYSKTVHDWYRGYKEEREGGQHRRRDIDQGLVTDGKLNPDALPTALNLQSVEDQRERQRIDEANEQYRANQFYGQRLTKEFVRAYDDQDKEAMADAAAKLVAHGLTLSDDVLADHELARKYERQFRDLIADPTKYPAQMWRRLQEPPR